MLLENGAICIETFQDWLEINRKVYNYALAERKDWYKSRSCQINACSLRSEYIIPADTPCPTYAGQCKSLTAAKQQYELKRVQSQVLQQILKRLENAFTSMWERNFGFPRFKKVGQLRSFVFPQLGKESLKHGFVKLPVIGWVKFRQSRDIPTDAALKQARIVKRSSGWYVMLTLQWNVSVPQPMPQSEALIYRDSRFSRMMQRTAILMAVVEKLFNLKFYPVWLCLFYKKLSGVLVK